LLLVVKFNTGLNLRKKRRNFEIWLKRIFELWMKTLRIMIYAIPKLNCDMHEVPMTWYSFWRSGRRLGTSFATVSFLVVQTYPGFAKTSNWTRF
jgi:hypothetical protein